LYIECKILYRKEDRKERKKERKEERFGITREWELRRIRKRIYERICCYILVKRMLWCYGCVYVCMYVCMYVHGRVK